MRIRPATVLDAPAISQVYTTWFENRYSGKVGEAYERDALSTTHDSWEKALADPGFRTIWVAVSEENIVGVLIADAMGPGEIRSLKIGGLFFTPESETDDVKSALLGYAIGDAPAFVEVLAPTPEELDFWTSEGFAHTDTNYDEHAEAEIAILER